MSTTNEEIPQLLKNLRLRKMAAILETELAAARKSSPSYSDFLVRLLQLLPQAPCRIRRRNRVLLKPAAIHKLVKIVTGGD